MISLPAEFGLVVRARLFSELESAMLWKHPYKITRCMGQGSSYVGTQGFQSEQMDMSFPSTISFIFQTDLTR